MPTAKEFSDIIASARNDRDRAVGAVLVLVFDGVISWGRAVELLGMSLMQLREEARRVLDEAAKR